MDVYFSSHRLLILFCEGNLSDGSALLVSQFGDSIKQGDKVGILLRLSNADLKMFLFHNDRPLGLAFHVNAPYPKPLYPGNIITYSIPFTLFHRLFSFSSFF